MGLPFGRRSRISVVGTLLYFFFPLMFKYMATACICVSIAQQWVQGIYDWRFGDVAPFPVLGRYLFLSTMPLIGLRGSAKVLEYTTRNVSQRIDRWIPKTELVGIVSIAFVGVVMMLSEHRGIVCIL